MNTATNNPTQKTFELPKGNNNLSTPGTSELPAPQVEVIVHDVAAVEVPVTEFTSLTAKLDNVSTLKRKMSITPEYKTFAQGESVVGAFFGIRPSSTKRSGMLDGVYWVGPDRKLYFNQAVILVDEVKKFSMQPGTMIEIVYKGKKQTRNAQADNFDVFILEEQK